MILNSFIFYSKILFLIFKLQGSQCNNPKLLAIIMSYSCHLGSRFLLMLGVFGALIVWPGSSLLILGFWKGELERAELGELSLFNGAVLRNIFGEFKMVL